MSCQRESPRREFTPVLEPGREFNSSTKSRNENQRSGSDEKLSAHSDFSPDPELLTPTESRWGRRSFKDPICCNFCMVLSMFSSLVLANSLFALRYINLTLGLLPPRRHMVPSTLDIACVAWRFCRAGRRSGVATKNSRAKRARTSGEAARKIWGYAFSFLRERNQSCLSGICFLRADIFMAHFIKITFTALSEERNFPSFIVFSIRCKESRLNGV